MATGLLVLGVNSSTRLLTFVVGLDKEYLATIRLGEATTTDDAEGEITSTAGPGIVARLRDDEIAERIGRLTGDIVQVPSAVSAIKVDGKRAYALVREGVDVQLASRPVTVSEFEVLSRRSAVAASYAHPEPTSVPWRATSGATSTPEGTWSPCVAPASGRSPSTPRQISAPSSWPTRCCCRPRPHPGFFPCSP
jgi:hypothetical protein